jgi:hypothetical protein
MRKIVVFASLLAAPAVTAIEPCLLADNPAMRQDPRQIRIKKFFEQNGCPLSKLSAEFVREADANDLDWRLLPSITFVESSGGKYYQNNNVFGWNSCHTRFSSVRAGLHLVASTLGSSTLYRDKNTEGILRIYNPSPEYASRVKSIMQILGARPESAELVLN